MTVREVTYEYMRSIGRDDAHIARLLEVCVRNSTFFQERLDMEIDEESAALLRKFMAFTKQLPPTVVKAIYERQQAEERSKN
jgi:hypothetical protein